MIFSATSWKLILEPARKPAAAAERAESNSEGELDQEQVEVSEAPAHCTRADVLNAKAREARGR